MQDIRSSGTGKRRRSIRLTVFLVIGICLVSFIVVLFSIFQTTMNDMLIQSEDVRVEEQMALVVGQVEAMNRYTRLMAEDVAFWDETIAFVQGENPDFIESNWPVASFLESYEFHFVVFQDLAGKVYYEEYYDIIKQEPLSAPEGFTEEIALLTGSVLAEFGLAEDNGVKSSGIVFIDNIPYYIYGAPIMLEDGGYGPAGVVFLGYRLDNAFLKNQTNFPGNYFEVTRNFYYVIDSGYHVDRSRLDTILAILTLEDVYGEEVILKVSGDRSDYQDGQRVIMITSVMMYAVVGVFIAVLYLTIVRVVLNPIVSLSHDIGEVETAGGVDVEKYSRTREFYALTDSINTMLERLKSSMRIAEESGISLDVFKRILNTLDACLYVTDAETDELLFFNDTLKTHFTLDDDAVGDKCWVHLQKGREKRCENCPVDDLRKTGKTQLWEEYSEISGRHYKKTACLIEWADHRTAILHCATDITQIRQAEQSLKRRLEQQELMSAISQSFIETDSMYDSVKEALRMTGEFLGVSRVLLAWIAEDGQTLEFVNEWVNPGQQLNSLLGAKQTFVSGDAMHETFIVEQQRYYICNDVEPDDRYRYLSDVDVKSFIDVAVYLSGELRGILCIDECSATKSWSKSDVQLVWLFSSVLSSAITRDAAENELIAMSSVFVSSPHFIAYIDVDGRIRDANQGAAGLTGYSVERLKTDGLAAVFSDETQKKMLAEIIPQALGEGTVQCELPVMRSDGETRLFTFSVFRIEREDRQVGVVAWDITESRQLELDLIAAKEQAEHSNRAKSDFLSRMSHEMRTPMNAVIGMANIAKSSPDPERKEYCMDKINEASRHLLGVINDILDMSKIEADKFELSETEFDCRDMLRRVVEVQQFRVDEKRQKLEVIVDPAVPARIVSDEQRLAQVLTNLLSNAVKFTGEEGAISLSVKNIAEDGSFCTLTFDVKDNGIGISEENQRKLFRSFEQADGSISRKFGGTGLGLTISRRIVNLMGGDITVESEEGQGASFRFSIRVEKGSQTDDISAAAPVKTETMTPEAYNGCLRGRRILLAEDVEINREIVFSILEKTGAELETAQDGREAYQMFAADPDRYDLILMDLHMPEVDGYESTRMIRGHSSAHSATVPILAMTANVFREDVERCLRAGMNDHIGKPIDWDEMLQKLYKYLCSGGAQGSGKIKNRNITGEENTMPNRQDYIDLEGGLARVRGNAKLFRRMLQMYLDGGEYQALNDALEQGDLQKAADAAHAIKGITGNLSLTKLFELSITLMEQLRQGVRNDDLIVEFRAVEAETRQVVEELVAQEDSF